MSLPPPEVAFRLLGVVSNHVLYSRGKSDPTFGHYTNDKEEELDQWWYLIPGTGDNENYFLLKSKHTGKVMYSRKSPDPCVGHVSGNGKYADNWFKLEFGTGDRANQFRIWNRESDQVLVSRTTREPEVYNHTHDEVWADQYFSFIYEPVNITRIEYHLDRAKISSTEPKVIGHKENINTSSHDQPLEFAYSEKESVSHRWDYTVSYTVSVSATTSFSVPLITNGEVTVEKSNTESWSEGGTKTLEKTITGKATTWAPPNTKVVCTLSMSQSAMTVPFTMYATTASEKNVWTIDGTYEGTTLWNLQTEYKEEAI